MKKVLGSYCFVLLVVLTLSIVHVQSGKIADCKGFKACQVTPGTNRCDIKLTRTKCNDNNGTVWGACVNQGCITNCICNCNVESGVVVGRSFS